MIATAWDATFTLFDGIPTQQDIARLSQNLPLQEAGRVDERSLTVSRANRSVRLWEHIVQRLATGEQPDENAVAQVSGGAKAAKLCPKIARSLGIGNSTSLGMALFLINQPMLLNNWISVLEEAIARVRSLPKAKTTQIDLFMSLFESVHLLVADWQSAHPVQIKKRAALQADLDALTTYLSHDALYCPSPWDRLLLWSQENLSE